MFCQRLKFHKVLESQRENTITLLMFSGVQNMAILFSQTVTLTLWYAITGFFYLHFWLACVVATLQLKWILLIKFLHLTASFPLLYLLPGRWLGIMERTVGISIKLEFKARLCPLLAMCVRLLNLSELQSPLLPRGKIICICIFVYICIYVYPSGVVLNGMIYVTYLKQCVTPARCLSNELPLSLYLKWFHSVAIQSRSPKGCRTSSRP